jgi:hypothetical protein
MPKSFEVVAHNGVIVLPEDVPPSARCMVTVIDKDDPTAMDKKTWKAFVEETAGSIDDPTFWDGKPLETHIQEQQTQPVENIDQLAGDFWPIEESVDEFIDFTRRQRGEDEPEN